MDEETRSNTISISGVTMVEWNDVAPGNRDWWIITYLADREQTLEHGTIESITSDGENSGTFTITLDTTGN